MEQRHGTPDASREVVATGTGGAQAPRHRRQRRWLHWATGAAMLMAVGVTTPQPAAACWYCGIVNAGHTIGSFFKDLASDLAGLTYDIITLDPAGAFYNLTDVFQDIVCPAISAAGAGGGEIAEALKNDNCDAPQGIAPEVLDRLRPYFTSAFDSVVIHEHCDFTGATAITFGEHIYFSRYAYGYQPLHASGQVDATGFSILAHELVHVLQYRQEGFSNFTCQYAQDCGLGAWIAGDTGISCQLEQQAFVHQVLVFEDVQRDGDGVFTCVPDDQEWTPDNFPSHTCIGKAVRDNCPDRFNPDQEDRDQDGVGNVCDGSDLVWRHVTGSVAIWPEGSPETSYWPGTVDHFWQIQGVGDFDGNGLSDLVWRHAAGHVSIWLDGKPETSYWPGTVDHFWQIQGVGDFDGNGISDLVWRHAAGHVSIWLDGQPETSYWPETIDSLWQIQGVGTFQ